MHASSKFLVNIILPSKALKSSSISNILGKNPLITAVWFAPWAAGGIVLAITSGLLLHLVPGRILLIISGTAKIVAVLFFALMPDHPNYWAFVFPAMLCEAACVDVLWTVSNVFLTTSLPSELQGLAGALIYITVFVGSAFFLAMSSVALGKFEARGMDMKAQYKGIFWIGVVVGAIALILCCFINIAKASSDGEKTTGEKTGKTESDFGSDSASVSSDSGADDQTVTGSMHG